MKYKVLIAALLAALVPVAVFAEDTGSGAIGAKGATELSLEQMLTYAIQDEYLARSEYETIVEHYGNVVPFSSIIRAEERHVQWLRGLYAAYGISPPVDESAAQVMVPESLRTALATGVQAEVDNIEMYNAFLTGAAATPLPSDVRRLFERLKSASENHLRAFRSNLSRYE